MPRSSHFSRIKTARAQMQDSGTVPQGMLPEPIERSWLRCASTGLSLELKPEVAPISQQELVDIREQNARLLHQARPEMENLQTQIQGTQSMVILTDACGTILHALGDADFVSKAERVALQPGVSWREEITGTNAIGTALVEQAPVFVLGAEHYFSQNAFLNCSAAPILDPFGQTIGVLDVSGDYRQPHAHTLALVRMSAQMIENRLFRTAFAHDITVHFHARPEFIGTLWEGIAAFSADGRLLAINRCGSAQLGLSHVEPGRLTFHDFFEIPLESFLSASKRDFPHAALLKTHSGHQLHARVDPEITRHTWANPDQPKESGAPMRQPKCENAILDRLDTGDRQFRLVLDRIKKVLHRDIPILIEGETGTGKELLAKAIHDATGRKGLFVAINCASIPEGLVEAELFGYEEGAFTGAKRHGVPGKIMQANGGTLFLDEIGEMPLPLQARLLRVLQEREIVPLGSAKRSPVDISVISATNRKLSECVDRGSFREDLYYRLNGLRVSLPPLREREDMAGLIARILLEESATPVSLHRETLALFRQHSWRGNVRQLRNVLRAALAFVDEDHVIRAHHLPEDFIEEPRRRTSIACQSPAKGKARLAEATTELILQSLEDHAGNVTQAAKSLGIGRATLYRKIQKLKQPR